MISEQVRNGGNGYTFISKALNSFSRLAAFETVIEGLSRDRGSTEFTVYDAAGCRGNRTLSACSFKATIIKKRILMGVGDS